MKLRDLHAFLGTYVDRWGDRYVIDSRGHDVTVVYPPESIGTAGVDERDRRLAVVLHVEARHCGVDCSAPDPEECEHCACCCSCDDCQHAASTVTDEQ